MFEKIDDYVWWYLGETPLHYASRRGDVVILNILLKAGSDVLAVDHQGRSCIHFAALGGSM